MAFQVQQDSDERTFRLVGELDLATVGQLTKQLAVTLQNDGDVRLDLKLLEFMDSCGIHALFQACQDLGGRGRVVLHAPTGEVAKVLELIRADAIPNLVIENDGGPR
jgi:anti-anti-sigma factor